MKTAYLFPGQGAQFVGMARDLYDEFAEARAVLDAANDILGYALTDVMFGAAGDETAADRLRQTENTQPALYVHSMAAMAVLEKAGQKPDMTAGHSLGEYSALAAAGALSFEEGLRLVRLRGLLMAGAGSSRPGTMAAVLGLEDETIEVVCRKACEETGAVVQPANYNAPGQIVISGDVTAVERAMALAPEHGAKKVVALTVSGAFHSPLMEEAREGLAEGLAKAAIGTPFCPVYLNVTAAPTTDPAEIRARLLQQLTAPVRWSHILLNQQADGATRFVEVGSGNVLTGLARRTLGKQIETVTAGKADELRPLPAVTS